MTDKIWQCCFTNTDHINGNAVKSGWTGLAVSESIPSAAYEVWTTQYMNLYVTKTMPWQ